ncbi:hypothetical protein [Winogradskyella sp. J14-2]|uniref:hypothetical protein n=1 Tax=Winogradskyella sp. J14-2 TaxID=1936080 RepID=UPI0012F806B3|nr:hypothetical protein [Winogradskyella sp. J14-2]
MRSNTLFISIITLFCFYNCATKRYKKSKFHDGKCEYLYVDDFSGTSISTSDFIVQKDTISVSALKFECTYSAFYTSWVMYNNYGEWNDGVQPENSYNTYLIWKDIDLFSNGGKYTVVTYGAEKPSDIYSSLMVFDDKGRDMLFENSGVKTKLIDLFSTEIRKKKKKKLKSIFHQKYIKQFRPEFWETYKTYPNVKIYIE